MVFTRQSSFVNALLGQCWSRFNRALNSREEKHTVTEIARMYGRGKGQGVFEGRRLHQALWGDPDLVLELERVSTPLPLAWRFRFGWLYGVADQVVFEKGVPVEVIEVKSYSGFKAYELIQASLYGLLVELNFHVRPTVRLAGKTVPVEVSNWESIALESITRATRRLKRI